MPDLSIQFHAVPSEIIPFVRGVVSEMNLYVVLVTFPPWAAREISLEDVPEAVIKESCERLVFTQRKPSLPAATGGELAERNPGALSLVIGRRTAKGLQQSWLACRTGGPPLNPVWTKIASKLRRATMTGVIATNPKTGASGPARSYRYTAAAKALFDQGVPMLPIAGGNVLRLG